MLRIVRGRFARGLHKRLIGADGKHTTGRDSCGQLAPPGHCGIAETVAADLVTRRIHGQPGEVERSRWRGFQHAQNRF